MRVRTTAPGVEALFLAAFLFAATNPLVRYMSPMWGDQAQVFARFAVAWLILLAINFWRKKKITSALRNKWSFVIALSVLQAVAILFYTLSVQRTTIANMLFVSYATTMFVQFALGTVLLHETVNRAKLLAIACSLIGLSLYSHSFVTGNSGVIFAVLAGATGTFANLMNKKLAGTDKWAVLQVQYGIGSVLLLGLVFALGGEFIKTASVGGILITIAFAITILIAAYLILYGYQHVDVNIATVLSSTELVFGVIMGAILFKEIPSAWEACSGLLITLGSMVAVIGQRQATKKRLTKN